MTDVEAELRALRDLVEGARAMPMSASAVINRAEVLAAIDRIREGWERATSESAALVAQRDQVVAEGEAAAMETVRLAELERDRLVSDTEVFRLASREGERLRTEAAEEALQLRRDADDYIEQRFANFEHSLERTLVEVRRGIANLAGRSTFTEEASSADGTHVAAGDDVLLSGHDHR